MLSDYLNAAWLLLVLVCCYAITIRDARIQALERANDLLRDDLADMRQERDEARQILAYQNERVGAYLKEATCLSLENERLKDGDMTDAEDIISGIDEWLEAQP